MDDSERRIRALELIVSERLALDPIPLITHLEDLLRSRQGEVESAALDMLTRVRGGFEPYAAGFGLSTPDETAAARG